MKKTTALIFLLAFAGLGLYFFFAEDYCHAHGRVPGGAFSHSHANSHADSVCLCFWSTLFSPGSFDFDHYQGVQRLSANPLGRPPVKAFDADIAHPPRLLQA